MSRVIDVNTHVFFLNKCANPECALPGFTFTNNSSKKSKSCDDFPTSIKNYMDWNNEYFTEPICSEIFWYLKKQRYSNSLLIISPNAENLSKELEYLSPWQQIYSKKLIYDAMHIGTLKKLDAKKHLNENVDGIVK